MMKRLTDQIALFLLSLCIIGTLSCNSSNDYPVGTICFTTGDDCLYCVGTQNDSRPTQIKPPIDRAPNRKIELRDLSTHKTNGLMIEVEAHDYPGDFHVSGIYHEWTIFNFDLRRSNWESVFSTGKINEYIIQNKDRPDKKVLTNGYLGVAVTTDGNILATVDLLKDELCLIDLNKKPPEYSYFKYPFDQHCARPEFFSNDNQIVYCTGTTAGQSGFSIVCLDRQLGRFKIWKRGSSPILTTTNDRVAYLNDSNVVVVESVKGDYNLSLDKIQVDELEQWINDRYLLALKAKSGSPSSGIIVLIDTLSQQSKEIDMSMYGGIISARFYPAKSF